MSAERHLRNYNSAIYFCSEFNTDLLRDPDNYSIIFSIEHEFYDEIDKVLKQFDFKCLHKSPLEKTITCCYILNRE